MIAEFTHPETGEKISIDIPTLNTSERDKMKREYTRDEEIKSFIEQLSVSAEAKAIILKLAKFTVSIGQEIVKMGKIIIEMVIVMVAKYKHTTFGLIVASLISLLIAAIPWVGPALAGFLGPIMMVYGLGKGFWEDLKKDSPELASSITEAGARFQPLNPTA